MEILVRPLSTGMPHKTVLDAIGSKSACIKSVTVGGGGDEHERPTLSDSCGDTMKTSLSSTLDGVPSRGSETSSHGCNDDNDNDAHRNVRRGKDEDDDNDEKDDASNSASSSSSEHQPLTYEEEMRIFEEEQRARQMLEMQRLHTIGNKRHTRADPIRRTSPLSAAPPSCPPQQTTSRPSSSSQASRRLSSMSDSSIKSDDLELSMSAALMAFGGSSGDLGGTSRVASVPTPPASNRAEPREIRAAAATAAAVVPPAVGGGGRAAVSLPLSPQPTPPPLPMKSAVASRPVVRPVSHHPPPSRPIRTVVRPTLIEQTSNGAAGGRSRARGVPSTISPVFTNQPQVVALAAAALSSPPPPSAEQTLPVAKSAHRRRSSGGYAASRFKATVSASAKSVGVPKKLSNASLKVGTPRLGVSHHQRRNSSDGMVAAAGKTTGSEEHIVDGQAFRQFMFLTVNPDKLMPTSTEAETLLTMGGLVSQGGPTYLSPFHFQPADVLDVFPGPDSSQSKLTVGTTFEPDALSPFCFPGGVKARLVPRRAMEISWLGGKSADRYHVLVFTDGSGVASHGVAITIEEEVDSPELKERMTTLRTQRQASKRLCSWWRSHAERRRVAAAAIRSRRTRRRGSISAFAFGGGMPAHDSENSFLAAPAAPSGDPQLGTSPQSRHSLIRHSASFTAAQDSSLAAAASSAASLDQVPRRRPRRRQSISGSLNMAFKSTFMAAGADPDGTQTQEVADPQGATAAMLGARRSSIEGRRSSLEGRRSSLDGMMRRNSFLDLMKGVDDDGFVDPSIAALDGGIPPSESAVRGPTIRRESRNGDAPEMEGVGSGRDRRDSYGKSGGRDSLTKLAEGLAERRNSIQEKLACKKHTEPDTSHQHGAVSNGSVVSGRSGVRDILQKFLRTSPLPQHDGVTGKGFWKSVKLKYRKSTDEYFVLVTHTELGLCRQNTRTFNKERARLISLVKGVDVPSAPNGTSATFRVSKIVFRGVNEGGDIINEVQELCNNEAEDRGGATDVVVSAEARARESYDAMNNADSLGDACLVEKCYVLMGCDQRELCLLFAALQRLIEFERTKKDSSGKAVATQGSGSKQAREGEKKGINKLSRTLASALAITTDSGPRHLNFLHRSRSNKREIGRHDILSAIQTGAKLSARQKSIAYPSSEIDYLIGAKRHFDLELPEELGESLKLPLPLPQVAAEWGLAKLLLSVGDDMLKVLKVLLLERSILLVGTNAEEVTSCACALLELLHPYEWPNTFLPLLPSSMLDLVHSPVPFIVGMAFEGTGELRKAQKDYRIREALDEGMTMVDLATGTVTMNLERIESRLMAVPHRFSERLGCLETRLRRLEKEDSNSFASLSSFVANGLAPREAVNLSSVRTCIRQYLTSLAGDVASEASAWQRYGNFNLQTNGFDFSPSLYCEPIDAELEFRKQMAHTQMFSGFVHSRRNEFLCGGGMSSDAAGEFISRWVCEKWHERRR